MYVKLINPFLAEIARLDTVRTEEADASGKAGYDAIFREPGVSTVEGERREGRAEKPPIFVPVQVEDRTWQALRMTDSGNSPSTSIGLVAHFRDLSKLGLVDPETARVALNVNDRLVAIRDMCKRPVSVVATPPGLYCTEVRPMSYGIGGRLNLLLLVFAPRDVGTNAR